MKIFVRIAVQELYYYNKKAENSNNRNRFSSQTKYEENVAPRADRVCETQRVTLQVA